MGKYRNIYFIGIGGIGMSAIARYFKFKGCNVSGYDRTPSDLTAELEKEGIPVHYTDDTAFVPADPSDTLVVYTPAIPHDMGELVYVQEHGYRDAWPWREPTARLPQAHFWHTFSKAAEKAAPHFSEAFRKTTAPTC